MNRRRFLLLVLVLASPSACGGGGGHFDVVTDEATASWRRMGASPLAGRTFPATTSGGTVSAASRPVV